MSHLYELQALLFCAFIWPHGELDVLDDLFHITVSERSLCFTVEAPVTFQRVLGSSSTWTGGHFSRTIVAISLNMLSCEIERSCGANVGFRLREKCEFRENGDSRQTFSDS